MDICNKGYFNDKLRIGSISLVVAFLGIMWILQPTFMFTKTGYASMTLILMACIIAFKEKIKDFNFNFTLVIPVIILGIGYFISFFLFKESNRIVMSFAMSIYPIICGFFIDNKQNRRIFMKGFSYGNTITFITLLIGSIIMAPLIRGQYYSIVLNPNKLSNVLMPIGVSLIYLMEIKREKKNKKSFLIFFILFSLSFSMMILSMSRTGLMAYSATIIIWILYLYMKKSNFKIIAKNVVIMGLTVVVATQFSIFLLSSVSRQIIKIEGNMFGKAFVYAGKEYGYVDNHLLSKINDNNYDALEFVEERITKGSRDGEDVSSGRFEIWKETINNLNFKGHSQDDEYYVPGRKLYTNDTHNIYLTIGYFLGIPFLLLVVIFMGLVFIQQYTTLYKRIKYKKIITPENLLEISTLMTFFILTFLASTYTSIGSMIGSLFWVTLPWYRSREK